MSFESLTTLSMTSTVEGGKKARGSFGSESKFKLFNVSTFNHIKRPQCIVIHDVDRYASMSCLFQKIIPRMMSDLPLRLSSQLHNSGNSTYPNCPTHFTIRVMSQPSTHQGVHFIL